MKKCFHHISKNFIRFVFGDFPVKDKNFLVEIFLDFFGRNFSIFVVETPLHGFHFWYRLLFRTFLVEICLQRFVGRCFSSGIFG